MAVSEVFFKIFTKIDHQTFQCYSPFVPSRSGFCSPKVWPSPAGLGHAGAKAAGPRLQGRLPDGSAFGHAQSLDCLRGGTVGFNLVWRKAKSGK